MSAADRVYERVKARILEGTYPAGELLSEVEVAGDLEVSRTPAHEAFRRLESEGLLRLIPRRGAVVVPVGPQEALDVLEVRHALEVAAVRRLAREGAAEARSRLAQRLAGVIEEQRTHAAAGDVAAFAVTDEAFHRAIVTASGNAIADRLYATLADRQRRMAVGAVGGRPARLPVLVAEHEALGGAVEAQDPEGFGRALLEHLHATHQVLLGGLA